MTLRLPQLSFSGGATLEFGYDQNYWIDDVAGTALDLDLGTDAIGNIVSLTAGTPAASRSYDYDALSRLTDVDDGNAALIEAFSYDATGNRLSKQTGSGTQSYTYPGTSHRLTSIDATARVYDAMGSLTDRGDGWTFEYDAQQRLTTVREEGDARQINTYNGKGERVRKVEPSFLGNITHTYAYDDAGRLVAEYRQDGFTVPALMREYLWLDDRLVAVNVLQGAYAGQLLHVHTDHLGTPRAITRPAASNAVVWRWELSGTAFGEHAPLQDPDGDGTAFVFNLRYPGQYFDSESGLHYNYFRDYEPGTGRYVESDPIGLKGGVNTYAYVRSQPLLSTDRLGLRDDNADPIMFEMGRQRGCAQRELLKSYQDMRDANFIGADKYFHCVGNCEAAKCGPFACEESKLISDWREIYGIHVKGDDPVDSAEDTRANDVGRNGGMHSPTTSCQVTCQQFRPAGLPSQY